MKRLRSNTGVERGSNAFSFKMQGVYLLLLCILYVSAKKDGAPQSQCSTLMPLHSGYTEQNSRPPYEVSAVKIGSKVKVTISSPVGEEFNGFILQARSRDGSRLIEGTFTRSRNTKTMDCLDGKMNTLTHVDPNAKSEVQTEWTPSGSLNEDIIFRATVVKTYTLFWTRVDSDRITIQSGGSASSNADRSSAGRKAEGSLSMYEGCYETKGCFAHPPNCINNGDCEVLLSFSKIANGIRFQLIGYLEDNMYMATGLSTDSLMGDDSVTECYREGSNVIARQSYNEGKNNIPGRPFPQDRYTGSYTNGLTTCTWTYPFLIQMNSRTYNLANDTYYALLAKGPMGDAGRLGYHNSRIASFERVNFTAIEGVEEARASDAVKVHGAFMVTAWIFFVSLGIILAKAFKNVWEQSSLCGQRIWFALHRAFMIASLVLIVIAFIVIFVHKNGWNYQTRNPHAILGCIAVALGLFQPIMAAFRPSPDHKNRPIFNWLHWTVGNSAQILAIITIFFAVSLESSGLKDSFYWAMAIYVIVHLIFHFMFQLHMFTSQKKKNNDLSMNEMTGGRTGVIENIQAKNITESVFKILLLGIYGIFLLVILLTLYALIAVA